ncbi:MAG: polyribonucleotide nucleotidyltransferase [Candidatus Berkelbacteria bacterium]|nr:polyribonucleotide nucleotidyltransferase [Candidatus Berkelbacteria bacterium]
MKENSIEIAGKTLKLSSGELAGQADGAVVAQMGETTVLATCVVGKEPAEVDYMPLSVDYEERFYASGKISGSRFIKREGRPSEEAVLTSRLVDRPIRPLFPKYFRHETQIVITVLSYDKESDPDILAIIAASAATSQSMAPFAGPVGVVRVGLIGGEFKVNPTKSEMAESELDLVICGTQDRVLMIESAARGATEEKVIEAIEFAKPYIAQTIEVQAPYVSETKLSTEDHSLEIQNNVQEHIGGRLHEIMAKTEKEEKEADTEALKEEVLATFEGKYKQSDLEEVFSKFLEKEVRKTILSDGIRPDGRKIDELREITAKVDYLPRTHGSGLFTRGQTQCLTVATLASPGMEQFIDTMETETTKRYMHFYNFPPYSTGEVKRMGSASRREIGHGALAEKALLPVIPSRDDFPYTVRLVSEILSSNGSSSMAATCGSTLALMDAGVPLKKPVAGIAMGMVCQPKDQEGSGVEGLGEDEKYKFAVLTDLQGVEDFGGDMDFKIAGTRDGITAIQLDVKIDGLSQEMIKDTLAKAKIARLKILDVIEAAIAAPRGELSPYAPRIIKVTIDPTKIGELIGPGGKNVQGIIAQAGGKELVSVDIEDDGTVLISSADANAAKIAEDLVKAQTASVELGQIYEGEVKSILKDRNTGKEIGAIVETLPGKDGMVHISEIANRRIEKVSDELKVGQRVKVKVVNIDSERGRVALSIKKVNGEDKAVDKS